ncbi:hypothetical protein H310_14810 [Aphanomyces invadans]|uniref:Chromo domain-containing protein n=1 Tax=Aphanomyces invadans TaxID=157072 RepID=A0A024TAT4_9STRA|nr:hypothetical protein H310_14810 [Aphanomyces invadans]ETV90407.1 hypothetical protein H310_14810 [Aphanomyces invadans]|eukprot:XP_008880963.1 hypothetical protein H310_14810 [Aphanomyces invadans]
MSPVTAFQGLPATPPLSGFVHPRTKTVLSVDWLASARQKHMTELRSALDNFHRDVAATSETLRHQARGRRSKKPHVKMAKFALGDYVLLGKVVKFPNKLALNWRGPYRVSRIESDYVMEIQQLVEPFATSVHHASRLKYFCDAALDVTDDLKEYAAFGDEGFFVEDLLGARCSAEGKYEVRVKWKGLEEEASWEPAAHLYEDIPVVFNRCVMKHASDGAVKAMRDDLEATLGRPL